MANHHPAPYRRPQVRTLPLLRATGLTLIVLGAVSAIAGTFLPWLRSGRVLRNSFEVVGTLDRFHMISDTFLRAVIGAWPLLGPAMFVPVLIAGFRCWRSAAAAAAALAVAGIAATVTALWYAHGRGGMGVGLVPTGPYTVICGSVILLTGAALVWMSVRRDLQLAWVAQHHR